MLIYEVNTKTETNPKQTKKPNKTHPKPITLVRGTMEVLNIDTCRSRMTVYAAHTENIQV